MINRFSLAESTDCWTTMTAVRSKEFATLPTPTSTQGLFTTHCSNSYHYKAYPIRIMWYLDVHFPLKRDATRNLLQSLFKSHEHIFPHHLPRSASSLSLEFNKEKIFLQGKLPPSPDFSLLQFEFQEFRLTSSIDVKRGEGKRVSSAYATSRGAERKATTCVDFMFFDKSE